MNLGAQTVTIGSAIDGATDRKGIPTTSYVKTVVVGCSIQPMNVKEDVTNIDYAIGKFNIFMPPVPAALACKTTDHITDANNQLYRVIGAKIWYRNGAAHHVTAVAEIPSGLNG